MSQTIARICTQCSEWIPTKRLVAKPNARLCISCQEQGDVLFTELPTDLSRLDNLYERNSASYVSHKFVSKGLASMFGNEVLA